MANMKDGKGSSNPLVQGKVSDAATKRVKETIKDKPDEAAGVLRRWIAQNKLPTGQQ